MKVIKDGEIGDPKKWQSEVVCKTTKNDDGQGCGAVLEIAANDLKLMYWEGTHFRHYYATVKCPQCGKYNTVKDVPEPVWEKLNTRKNRRKAIFDGHSDSIF